jgi:hypothetical protein
MKRPANMSLVCVYADTEEAHGDCLKVEDCGCGCHGPTQIQESTDATT